MRFLGFLLLSILHGCYALTRAFQALAKRLNPRRRPRPIHVARDKIPKHIALVLAHGDAQKRHGQLYVQDIKAMLESVLRVVEWCQAVGVGKLTVYDREGVLESNASYLRRKLIPTQPAMEPKNSLKPAKLVSYPLTPPASDASTEATEADSDLEDNKITLGMTQFAVPSSSPESQPLHLNIISDKDGRTEVALCARQIAAFQRDQKTPLDSASLFQLDINTLDAVLEAKLQSPDMLLVHSMSPGVFKRPLELHAFPPWQIRLTEMHHSQVRSFSPFATSYIPVEEDAFARALDIYSDAEFRVGK
ncbi:hypothetical protein RhiJN_04627 [Ceratobasidium sp. AG-Ba]|nr:hypothetical protein RhiJN_04627 [Ceratobasidium sp. AG-Ba]